LRGLSPDEVVRQRTIAINEQIVRLREARLAHEKQREEAALKEVQYVVEEMARLKESLTAAEVAAVEFVNQIGDQAQAQLEEDWNQKSEAVMATVMTQQKLGLGADLPTASLPSEAVSSTTVEVQTTTSPSKT